ncbi:hypothetical protein [Bacillus sp. 0102A]|uniref:hypothetical protein n=1 Tax=Bacillus sp. 0102A TaxID=3120563 RepID=UPI002FDAD216
MISICLKKSLKQSSTSQAALAADIVDTGITAAAGAGTTAVAQVKEDTTTVMAAVIVTNAGATAAVNLKKVLVPLLGQGFFYVTD